MTERYRIQANYKIKPYTRDRIRLLSGLLNAPGGNVIDRAIDELIKSSEIHNLMKEKAEVSKRQAQDKI